MRSTGIVTPPVGATAGRPSADEIVASGTFHVARCGAPWSLRIVPAIRMSSFGTRYEPTPDNLVMKPGSVWQYGLVALTSGATPLPISVIDNSGSCDVTAQMSWTVLPLLTPPWNVSPLVGRTETLTRMPLYLEYSVPKLAASVMLLAAPRANACCVML